MTIGLVSAGNEAGRIVLDNLLDHCDILCPRKLFAYGLWQENRGWLISGARVGLPVNGRLLDQTLAPPI